MRLAVHSDFRGCFMKNLSAAKSTSPYSQCLICREWSWDACNSFDGATLCLPCYVDVLELRQERMERAGGVMGAATRFTSSASGQASRSPESDESPGNSPPPFLDPTQRNLFDS